MRTCDLDGCDAKHYGRGLCQRHHYRWRTHGDASIVLTGHRYTEIDPAARLAAHAERRGTCLIYTRGQPNHAGHRAFVLRGVKTRAHRAAWALAHGEVPDGLCVLHRCDVGSCINVAHLFLGTAVENNEDRDQKGRHVALPGSRHGNAKLSEWQVQDILRLAAEGVGQRALADRFATSQTNVSLIVTGRAWTHVARPRQLERATR